MPDFQKVLELSIKTAAAEGNAELVQDLTTGMVLRQREPEVFDALAMQCGMDLARAMDPAFGGSRQKLAAMVIDALAEHEADKLEKRSGVLRDVLTEDSIPLPPAPDDESLLDFLIRYRKAKSYMNRATTRDLRGRKVPPPPNWTGSPEEWNSFLDKEVQRDVAQEMLFGKSAGLSRPDKGGRELLYSLDSLTGSRDDSVCLLLKAANDLLSPGACPSCDGQGEGCELCDGTGVCHACKGEGCELCSRQEKGEELELAEGLAVLGSRLAPEMKGQLSTLVDAEFAASMLYLAVAGWADARGLKGIAGWARSESESEAGHARTVGDFANTMGAGYTPSAVAVEPVDPKAGVAEVFKRVLEAEKAVESAYKSATEEAKGDVLSENFLQVFYTQQVTATQEALGMYNKAVSAGDAAAMLMDAELAVQKTATLVMPELPDCGVLGTMARENPELVAALAVQVPAGNSRLDKLAGEWKSLVVRTKR